MKHLASVFFAAILLVYSAAGQTNPNPQPDPKLWYRIRERATRFYLNTYESRFGRTAEPLCIAPAVPNDRWYFKKVGFKQYEIVNQKGNAYGNFKNTASVVGRLSGTNNIIGDNIVNAPQNDAHQVWVAEHVGATGDEMLFKFRAVQSELYIGLGPKHLPSQPVHFALNQVGASNALVWELVPDSPRP